MLFGAFIRRKKETTKFDYKCFNLRRDIIRSDDISSEIETFVVEFSCFFLSSYIYIYIYNGGWCHFHAKSVTKPVQCTDKHR